LITNNSESGSVSSSRNGANKRNESVKNGFSYALGFNMTPNYSTVSINKAYETFNSIRQQSREMSSRNAYDSND
jgi:hypothetical protein